VCVCVCSFLLFLLLRLLSRREMWKYFSINIYVALYAWIVNAQAQMEQNGKWLWPCLALDIEQSWALFLNPGRGQDIAIANGCSCS